MDRAISLGGTIYNTRHIVSFYKYQNPATKRLFIVLTLVAAIEEEQSVVYDSEEDRTSDFKLLMSCFEF